LKKCRITVVKVLFDEELAQQYAVPGFGPCNRHKVGETFLCDWRKPDGLCDEAWKAIHHYVMTLTHDGGNFYGGGWLKDNIAICACNDGIRPVIFKLEPVDSQLAT